MKILIVEDDSNIFELERDYLEANGFTVAHAVNGEEGLRQALDSSVSLVILDIMLPGLDGFHICRELRKERDIPVIIVSARREEIDKVRGRGLGADDYMVKPFSPGEMVARVKAHLGRYERLTKAVPEQQVFSVRGLEIQPDAYRVFRDGEEIRLTHKEFELLLFMAKNAGIVFSKDRLFEKIWGFDAAGDNATVMVHVNRLREKIEPNPQEPIYIQTVWGAGYRFAL